MRLPCNDGFVLIDAERVWLAGAADAKGESVPPARACHRGDPASTLAELLAQLPKRRSRFLRLPSRLRVLLGAPWTYGALLPWQDNLWDDGAWRAYALAVLASQGVETRDTALHLCIESAGFGHARLASAVDAQLVERLQDSAMSAGWRIVQCRDTLSTAAARHARCMPRDAVLALFEPTMLTCLFRQAGQWTDLTSLARAPGQSPSEALGVAMVLSRAPAGLPVCTVDTVAHPDIVLEPGWTRLGAPDAKWAWVTACER